MAFVLSAALGLALTASPVRAAGLEQIEHVVLFMQENRAFNHYFGTMAGVRGFNDPNVQVNSNGRSVWYQSVILQDGFAVGYALTHKNTHTEPWTQACPT